MGGRNGEASEHTPRRSTPIKPMPAIGCGGRYFRDSITEGVGAIDVTCEHSTAAGEGASSARRSHSSGFGQ